jgi:5-methylthioadenosine/S-adenosylhomocysteine deaminase
VCLVAAAACHSSPPPPADTTNFGSGAGRMLLVGTIVTPDVVIDGEVLVDNGTIECVDSGKACESLAIAADAVVFATHGIIAPGLIDTHNHILFDIFDNDDWYPTKLYQNHDQWPAEPRYVAMLDTKQCLVDDAQGKPAWCAQTPYGTSTGSLRCEADKWGELKGLVAGTTSIVGLAGTSGGCFASIARSVDTAESGLAKDTIQTSALYPPSSPSTACQNFASGKTDAYLIHAGEGIDAKSLGEFAALGTMTTPANCLYAPQVAITHGTAFTATEFGAMAAANMKLIWSPHSNVSLYGQTADIPTALAANVTVALAPDWSMGGSQNLLDEMRFADAWDNAHWSDRLTAQDLVTMSTSHAATALALDTQLGKLAPGYLADIAVFDGDTAHPYDAIVAARPDHVKLVMIDGVVMYGDVAFQPAPPCEVIDVCGTAKFVCAATASTTNKLDETVAQIQAALGQALVDADALTPDGYDFAPLAPLATCQ